MLCASVGVLSVADPGWAVRLKAEGYYADLRTHLFAPTRISAGGSMPMTVAVYNDGPSSVSTHTLHIDADPSLSVSGSGCEPHPDGGFACVDATQLEPGASAWRYLSLSAAPAAIGPAALGVLASSPNFDPAPHDNFAVGGLWIERHYDLQVSMDPQGPQVGESGTLVGFIVHNAGPSLAPQIELFARQAGAATHLPSICIDGPGSQCLSLQHARIGPNASLRLVVLVPPLASPADGFVVSMAAIVPAAEEIYPDDNQIEFGLGTQLFGSGFE